MIIYFGDLHIKESEPHRTASLNFLKWLLDNYEKANVICGGDLFDSSSINHDLVTEVTEILKQFENFIIINGNHDQSKRMGSILKPLCLHDNISLVHDLLDIEGISFRILPHTYSQNKDYENIIDGTWDYSLSHLTPIQEAFNEEDGVELKFNVDVAHVFSHIHRHSEYDDNFGNKILIAGSVINTRHGEENWEKNVYELKKDGYVKIPVPQDFTYRTIKYGDEIEKTNDVLNVTDAPSVQSVLDKYKGFYVREEGIKLESLKSEEDDNEEITEENLIKNFNIFALDNDLDEVLKNTCLKYLKKQGE